MYHGFGNATEFSQGMYRYGCMVQSFTSVANVLHDFGQLNLLLACWHLNILQPASHQLPRLSVLPLRMQHQNCNKLQQALIATLLRPSPHANAIFGPPGVAGSSDFVLASVKTRAIVSGWLFCMVVRHLEGSNAGASTGRWCFLLPYPGRASCVETYVLK